MKGGYGGGLQNHRWYGEGESVDYLLFCYKNNRASNDACRVKFKAKKGQSQPVKSLPKAIVVVESLNVQGETGTFGQINGRETY